MELITKKIMVVTVLFFALCASIMLPSASMCSKAVQCYKQSAYSPFGQHFNVWSDDDKYQVIIRSLQGKTIAQHKLTGKQIRDDIRYKRLLKKYMKKDLIFNITHAYRPYKDQTKIKLRNFELWRINPEHTGWWNTDPYNCSPQQSILNSRNCPQVLTIICGNSKRCLVRTIDCIKRKKIRIPNQVKIYKEDPKHFFWLSRGYNRIDNRKYQSVLFRQGDFKTATKYAKVRKLLK